MARAKDYKSKLLTPSQDIEKTDISEIETLVVELPFNSAIHVNKIDLTRWLGQGFDEWVKASAIALRNKLRGGASPATVVSIANAGLNNFFIFLAEGGIHAVPTRPRDIQSLDVNRFVAWLRRKFENGRTGRSSYVHFKSLLMAIADSGLLGERDGNWLPANPFPKNEWPDLKCETLSPEEMKRLAAALKSDLVAIHQGSFTRPHSEAICVPFLILALRSGINLTPLLEMKRDCLRPHPIMPNMMLLDTVKRRAGGHQSTLLRKGSDAESSTAIQMDSVGVLKKALEMTANCSDAAPAAIKDRIWLYQSSKHGAKEVVTCLSDKVLALSIKSIVTRYNLLADDGRRLNVNVGILRKTKENILWRLTDGDLEVVASAMGHSPKVADSHYLMLDDRAKAEGASFIGEAFVDGLRGTNLTPTPTGSCKDSLRGERAPKDGSTHCSEFMHCLSCPSYAIVGSVDDLHRLFSFQQFLRMEMSRSVTAEWTDWRMHREQQAAHIDNIANDNFPSSIVEEARAMAERKPHPFWKIKMQRASTASDGEHHG